MDTDTGPLLSAPRSRTGSWPCHKCEHLMDTRETQHILTRERKRGDSSYCSCSHFLSLSHQRSHFSRILQATRLPSLILAELTLRCRQQNSAHSAIIRFLCCAVALRSHLNPCNLPSPFHPFLQLQSHNPSPPYRSVSVQHRCC